MLIFNGASKSADWKLISANHILEVDTEHAMKNRYFLKRMETLKGVNV